MQNVLTPANRDYFNQLIAESAKAMASYLPVDVDIALPDESGEQDYILRPMLVTQSMKEEFIRDYVDELDLFGNDLIGTPLTTVFEGCVKEEEESILEHTKELDERVKAVCSLIWARAFNEIMYEKYPDISSAAQLNFTEQLYEKAYEEYYNDRNADGYTAADRDRLCDDVEMSL